MSKWTTVSVETPDGDHFYRTEFKSWGQSQMDQPLPQEVDGSQLAKVCIIACHDTSDAATIAYSEWDKVRKTKPHKESLWTVDIDFGPSYDWEENAYAELPEWCLVRGNWKDRIDR